MKTLRITEETHKRLTMIKGEILAESGDASLTYDDAIYRLITQWNEENERRGRAPALKAYHHVRHRWWEQIDLEGVKEELGEKYTVERSIGPTSDNDIDVMRDEKITLLVKADTLGAYLDVYKAVMYQREAAPFTAKDVELREKLFEMYNMRAFLEEPKFVVLE